MTKLHAVSGYDGTGKSTLLNAFQQHHNCQIIPETARELIPLQETLCKKAKDSLSFQVFIADLTNLISALSNTHEQHVVADRAIVDSVTYLRFFNQEDLLDMNMLGEYLQQLTERYNRQFVYDNIVLLQHPTDIEYISQQILSDPIRKSSGLVSVYIENANRWEDLYMKVVEELHGYPLTRSFTQVAAYPTTPDIIPRLTRRLFEES